ncbi:MAG: DUF3775 domain-containing protein [Cypionkella sp.]
MIELPFDSAEIDELVLRFKSVMAREGMDMPDLGGNASDDEVTEMLQETEGDLSRDEITQEIESMNDEQQDALVVLFWIGRGDVEPESWADSLLLARERHSGLVSKYLLSKPLVATYLADGMAAMEDSGLLDE